MDRSHLIKKDQPSNPEPVPQIVIEELDPPVIKIKDGVRKLVLALRVLEKTLAGDIPYADRAAMLKIDGENIEEVLIDESGIIERKIPISEATSLTVTVPNTAGFYRKKIKEMVVNDHDLKIVLENLQRVQEAQKPIQQKEKARKLVQTGDELASSNKRKEALAAYSEAITLDPNLKEAYVKRADLFVVCRERNNARSDYDAALKIDPQDAEVYLKRAKVQSTNEARILDCTKALEISPNYIDALRYRAEKPLFRERYSEAEGDLNRAIEIEPNNIDHYLERAAFFDDTKQDQRALDDLSKALQIDPTHQGALKARIDFVIFTNYFHDFEVRIKRPDFVHALLEYLSELIELYPENPDYHRLRGRYFFHIAENYQAAYIDFTRAIACSPCPEKIYYDRAEICTKLHSRDGRDNYTAAIPDLSRAIELNPDYYYAYTRRGLYYGFTEEYHRAFKDYTDAIRLEPNRSHNYFNRGKMSLEMGMRQKAIADFDKGVELDPTSYNYFQRSYMYQKSLKDYKKALSDINKVIALSDKPVEIYFRCKAEILFELGRKEEAIEAYWECLIIDPNQEYVREKIEELKKTL